MTQTQRKQTSQVFGISNTVIPDSYVDRGDLDDQLARLLKRDTHIAVRGASKCGKSWLRQKGLPDAIVVQCRLDKPVSDIYVDALSQLEISLEMEKSEGGRTHASVEARGEVGVGILAKLGFGATTGSEETASRTGKIAGHDVGDLRFIANVILNSGRSLVIEDFHYLAVSERRRFSFDLKALWDYGLFVTIVGVWNQSNMLLHLNPDLTGRVNELSVFWSDEDLNRVLQKGGSALRLAFSREFAKRIVADCFNNVGILQTLILSVLDELGIEEQGDVQQVVSSTEAVESAAMAYADQLNPLYQQFAQRVAKGIRSRRDSTGIYAHAMAAILEADDADLLRGYSIDEIHSVAHSREPRIQKGNLRTVLEKFEQLQVDDDGRGLVLAYNDADGEISVVDRQLLLYRKYLTVRWPWEDLIKEAGESQEP